MEKDLIIRTKKFALRSIKLFRSLPHNDEARICGKQFLRSATSTAANYRAARRARSDKEFIAKLSIVLEEVDESLFWLEILHESEIIQADELANDLKEAEELVKIFASARNTAKKKRSQN